MHFHFDKFCETILCFENQQGWVDMQNYILKPEKVVWDLIEVQQRMTVVHWVATMLYDDSNVFCSTIYKIFFLVNFWAAIFPTNISSKLWHVESCEY